jgi:uncharacterized protein YjbI with pentapeptide repeats
MSGVNLKNASLSGANLDGTYLTGANLKGAKVSLSELVLSWKVRLCLMVQNIALVRCELACLMLKEANKQNKQRNETQHQPWLVLSCTTLNPTYNLFN